VLVTRLSLVLMLPASICTSTRESVGSSPTTIWPENSSKRPRTFAIIM
jgi:hypothetical protein